MATTLTTNVIVPEVLADYVEAKLGDNSVFAPLCDEDNSLVGGEGNTLTVPKYSYIGAATVVAENGQISTTALNATSVDKKVEKYAKGVQVTDEALMSAYGDIASETGTQLAKAIDDLADAKIEAELNDACTLAIVLPSLSSDGIIDALAIFGEDEAGAKSMVLSAKDLASLRKDDDYVKNSDRGSEMVIKGETGEIWGCGLIPSNRCVKATERVAYIIKPGAIKKINKKGVAIEPKREADFARTSWFATKYAIPYLQNESKAIKIMIPTALGTTDKVASVAGDATNGTVITIGEAKPVNAKWVYKLGTSDVTPTYGTAVTGFTDWAEGVEIAAASNTKACVVLVDGDNKPLKYTNIALVKG